MGVEECGKTMLDKKEDGWVRKVKVDESEILGGVG